MQEISPSVRWWLASPCTMISTTAVTLTKPQSPIIWGPAWTSQHPHRHSPSDTLTRAQIIFIPVFHGHHLVPSIPDDLAGPVRKNYIYLTQTSPFAVKSSPLFQVISQSISLWEPSLYLWFDQGKDACLRYDTHLVALSSCHTWDPMPSL